LFPRLEETLGPLTDVQKKLIAILEVVRVEAFLPPPRWFANGRPPEDRRFIARAFVAKAVLNLPHTRGLIERLRSDTNLRSICGWQRTQDVPSESSFSRAFAEFADTGLPAQVHAHLVKSQLSESFIGHIARDSTAIEGREKPKAKDPAPEPAPTTTPSAKRGRPRKGEVPAPKAPSRLETQAATMDLDAMLADLPTACDRGCKKNSQGFVETWTGYKAHLDVSNDGHVISFLLTSASVHDSQAAIPLALMSSRLVTNSFDLMDAAYDAPAIREVCRRLGHVPVIDHNPRRSGKKQLMDAETARLYNGRSVAERANSQLKDNFGGRSVRVRGAAKVATHLMFGVLALTASQLLRLLC
jgi:hypothetical protein